MNLQQAKTIVRQHQLNKGFFTLRQAFDDLCVYKHLVPIEQYVATDIISRGYSDYTHLLSK
jgi:hypothetical protein